MEFHHIFIQNYFIFLFVSLSSRYDFPVLSYHLSLLCRVNLRITYASSFLCQTLLHCMIRNRLQNSQETADLVTLTEEILNGKLHFLCSEMFWSERFFSQTVKDYFNYCSDL